MDGGGLQKKPRALQSPRVRQTAQAELVEEFLKCPFQIVKVELGIPLHPAPEQGMSLASQCQAKPAFLSPISRRGITFTGRGRGSPYKYSSNFEQSNVVG